MEKGEDKDDETTKKSEEGNNKMVVHSKREKESANKSEEDNNKMDVDSKMENEENVALHEQGNLGYETKDAKHSESAQVPLSKDEPDEENQKEENEEAMEIDCAVEEQVEKDIKVGGALDNACNESAGASMATQDVSIAEADNNDSNVVKEMEIDDCKNNTDMAGVKRKADVLSEDSFAKVSFAQRPSFKIGACIARAASQMAGSPSVFKGSNFGDETLSVESFVSQLHSAATDPVKENVVSDIAVGFFLDFRNSSASQQLTPEKVSSKRARLSNSNAGGTEAFEFEEMGDTCWTDRVIHNGGEEQTPPTEKGNYQVVPVELKPAQVQRTRRPYRRRQSQISIPHSASTKPAGFGENAPAELIMNFSETDIIPPEKSLSEMFRHFGPIKESLTEVDREKHWARVVFKKGADAEVASNSAGRFNIFGTKVVKYELSHTITETFKVQPYVVPLGEEDAAKGESSKTSKKSGRKTRSRERLAASSSRDPRAFGHLKLFEEHESDVKVLTPYQRENCFFVYIDTDNIKNELPVSFDVNDMRYRIEVVLRARFNQNYNVMKVVAIGNMWAFFDGERKCWRGVQVTDVYPRNATCGGICEQQIQFANPSLRRPVPYERCTDIADDMLQNAMFNDVQDYDPRNFLLITGDCDFVRPVTILEDCGVKVYLAAPRGCSGLLRGAVSDDCTFDFSEVYLR